MSIPGREEQGKQVRGFARFQGDILLFIIVLLVISAAFALGIMVGTERAANANKDDKLWIEQLPESALYTPQVGQGKATSTPTQGLPAAVGLIPPVSDSAVLIPTSTGLGSYVASKNGTKYYPADCESAKRISDANRVWFGTPAAAEAAGYKRTTACQ